MVIVVTNHIRILVVHYVWPCTTQDTDHAAVLILTACFAPEACCHNLFQTGSSSNLLDDTPNTTIDTT
jgi:hypothetical protein